MFLETELSSVANITAQGSTRKMNPDLRRIQKPKHHASLREVCPLPMALWGQNPVNAVNLMLAWPALVSNSPPSPS